MKSWLKTFALFILLALLFISNINDNAEASYINTYTQQSYTNKQIFINSEQKCSEYYFTTQNIPNSSISSYKNNDNYGYLLESANLLTFLENKFYFPNIYKTFNNRISHNVSPNLEYAIYTRAP